MGHADAASLALLLLTAITTRNAAFLALGFSLMAFGIALLALVKVSTLNKAQAPRLYAQAGELGDLTGRAAQVERKLGGPDGDP